MGTDKRKRKSSGALSVEPSKERRLEVGYPKWEDHCGYTILKLADQQSVLFLGEATLQVLQGAVRVAGKLITVESPPLKLSTGGRFNLAFTIQAEAPVTQIPLAASQLVEVSLQSRPPLPQLPQPPQQQHPQQQPNGAVVTAGGSTPGASWAVPSSSPSPYPHPHPAPSCTFSLHRPTDPRAPPALTVSNEWARAISQVCSAASSGAPVVLAVLGAKGMGKSSLARLTVNRLLDELPLYGSGRTGGAATAGGAAAAGLGSFGSSSSGSSGGGGGGGGCLGPAVAFLDTDVGQPEFTPPGLVSLHLLGGGGRGEGPLLGPPHAHPRRPWAARFVGDASPEHDPHLYLAAVQALYGSYWGWAQRVVAAGGAWPPLVVNTHGWVKGLGFDLLTQLLRLVAPTHVIQIRGGPEKKNLPRGAFWCDPRDPQAAAAPTVLLSLESLAEPNNNNNTSQPPIGAQQHQQQQQQAGGGNGGAGNGGGGGGGASPYDRDRDAGGAARQRGGGNGGGGGGGPAAALRSLKPVESRALAWHAWAKRVIGWEPAWGSYESDDFWRTAGALASLPPWRIRLDALHVQLLGGSLPPRQLGRLLNGAVVGLLATQPPPPQQQQPLLRPPAAAVSAGGGTAAGGRGAGGSSGGGGGNGTAAAKRAAATASHAAAAAAAAAAEAEAEAAWWDVDVAAAAAAYPPGRVSYAGAASVPPPLLPCVGLGIVRAVDMQEGCVYVLTDVAPELLDCVGALVVGRLELPGSLVVGGEVASPYQQLFGLSAEATGAGTGKARKNLSRSSLVDLAG